MAPLNPYAPLYRPTVVAPPFEFYSPPPCYVVPPPLPPFEFYFNHSPSGPTFFYYSWQAPFPFAPPLFHQEKAPVSLVGEGASEARPDMITGIAAADEIVKEAPEREGPPGWASWRVRRIWRPKSLRSLDDVGARRIWAPKSRNRRNRLLLSSALEDDFRFKGQDDEEERLSNAGDSRTTIMIKNLPNKMSKEQLMDLLDSHCSEENQKLGEMVEGMGSATPSQYDFLYLPMDFDSACNLGYAFVNFTSAVAARRLHRAYHKRGWDVFGSRKIREVTYARIQGLPALLKHFRGSVFNCHDDEYLPVYFTPSRDGTAFKYEQYFVGKRIPSSGRSNV